MIKKYSLWKRLILAVLPAAAVLGLSACYPEEVSTPESGTVVVESRATAAVAKEPVEDISQAVLRDKDSLYEDDQDDSVVTMYMTVRRGNTGEGTNHSWEEINSYSVYDYDDMGVDRYQVEALLQVGDENEPVDGELGYGTSVPNATVQIRGQTSSRNPQKNYKIRLKDNKGTWNQQQTISLNKHQSDGLRFRNKLSYDLIKGIPQMMSLRTQFVHLYVKDETDGDTGEFVDYGLYTQVEQLNKTALRAHGLDRSGHLYKINSCEFFRYEDEIELQTDPGYDQAAFERRLEIKGNTDHTKLIQMLEDVNNYSIPISELLEKYFNVENLTYWMAFNILTANVDTQNRNFYIYSPTNSDIWYFISWDNDGNLRRYSDGLIDYSEASEWEIGVSNYWGNILFRRCLQSDIFLEELDKAILDLKGYLSPERINGMTAAYRAVVKPFVYSMPDIQHAPLTPEVYDQVLENLPNEIDRSYELYLESLKKPLPFYIGVPRNEDGKLKIGWDVSYDFDMEDITYEAKVARDPYMNDIIASYTGLWPEMEMELPETGQYFVKVESKNTSEYMQTAFDYYVTENGKVYGIRCFYILPDGTIGEDVYEE